MKTYFLPTPVQRFKYKYIKPETSQKAVDLNPLREKVINCCLPIRLLSPTERELGDLSLHRAREAQFSQSSTAQLWTHLEENGTFLYFLCLLLLSNISVVACHEEPLVPIVLGPMEEADLCFISYVNHITLFSIDFRSLCLCRKPKLTVWEVWAEACVFPSLQS